MCPRALVVGAFLVAAGTSCAAVKAYPGRTLKKDELALVATNEPFAVLSVDGVPVETTVARRWHVLPGHRVVRIRWDGAHPTREQPISEIAFEPRAGGTYDIEKEILGVDVQSRTVGEFPAPDWSFVPVICDADQARLCWADRGQVR